MASKKITKRISREFSAEQKEEYAKVRKQVMEAFPSVRREPQPSPLGIPTQIRMAREARGLSWYALAKQAGIPNSNTIRDIEQGRDVKLSNLQAVVNTLGLSIELVETA